MTRYVGSLHTSRDQSASLCSFVIEAADAIAGIGRLRHLAAGELRRIGVLDASMTVTENGRGIGTLNVEATAISNRTRMTAFPKWRRTIISGLDGKRDFNTDDWHLDGGLDHCYARIYKVRGGPQGDRWFWAVQVDVEGRSWNGGTGYADTGREAREACEARLPERLRPKSEN